MHLEFSNCLSRDTMDKAFYYKDMKSLDCSSPTDLDRRSCEEHKLLSALQLDQLSTSGMSNDSMVNNGSDVRLSVLDSLSTSMDPLTPSQVSFVSSINEPDTEGSYLLAVPLQGKSSTPQITIEKQKKVESSNLSYAVLGASQISWDVSLIKSEGNMELDALESALSPKPSSSSQAQTGLFP